MQDVLASPPSPKLETGSFSVSPAPEWVVHDPYDSSAPVDDKFVHGGICELIRDEQVDVSSPAFHTRLSFHIVSQAGAERVANFAVGFDPSYQTMEVHFVRVVRDGAIFDHARRESFDILRREQNLERRILNGQLTASLIIPDVRAGDVVEMSWTVKGQNPALQGIFSHWTSLEMTQPSREMRFRLRRPTSRNIRSRSYGDVPDPVVTDIAGIVDARWCRRDCAAMSIEAYTPSWQQLARSVQFSEAGSWGEVARLFAPHYAIEKIPSELQQVAESFAKEEDEGARVVRILQYVQSRIRYLSISLGEGGLIPRSPEQICASGYGDCKDAARLFVLIARTAGLDAAPGLVATRYSPAINNWLPSGGIFDHCIVRVRLAGRSYWLDPTLRSQGGTLDEIYRPHIGWALPLTDDTDALEEMQASAQRLMADTFETVDFGPKVSSDAVLRTREIVCAAHADAVRNQIANEGGTNVLKNLRKRFENEWPGLDDAAPAAIEDDNRANRITITGSYTLHGPWKKAGENRVAFGIADNTMSRNLGPLPNKEKRKNDIYLGAPRILRRRVEMNMPRDWSGNPSDFVLEIPGARYTKHIWIDLSRKVVQTQELVISAHTTPASSAADYSRIVQELRDRMVLTVSSPISADKFISSQAKKKGSSWPLVWGVIWLLVMLLSALSRMATPPS
jgi:transglutaminase-like putative cysteine protease